MMDLATLIIQIALVAFLVWGGVLSLLCIARNGAWKFPSRDRELRPASSGPEMYC